jgi:hypothetical protein
LIVFQRTAVRFAGFLSRVGIPNLDDGH